MDESAIRRRLGELLSLKTLTDRQASSHAFQGALTLLTAVYGPTSPHVKDLERLAGRRSPASDDSFERGSAAKGALQNLQGDLDAGLVGSLRNQIAGSVIAGFLDLARLTLEQPGDNAKNVAAVLAAAAYEDTLRRMGAELAGVVERPKLAVVLENLKSSGALQGSQFGIAQSYLQFRNDALHADWPKLQRESVASVLGFVEQLLLKHFS